MGRIDAPNSSNTVTWEEFHKENLKLAKEEFKETDDMFFRILRGEYKAPSELVIKLYEERKELRDEIRRAEWFHGHKK